MTNGHVGNLRSLGAPMIIWLHSSASNGNESTNSTEFPCMCINRLYYADFTKQYLGRAKENRFVTAGINFIKPRITLLADLGTLYLPFLDL